MLLIDDVKGRQRTDPAGPMTGTRPGLSTFKNAPSTGVEIPELQKGIVRGVSIMDLSMPAPTAVDMKR